MQPIRAHSRAVGLNHAQQTRSLRRIQNVVSRQRTIRPQPTAANFEPHLPRVRLHPRHGCLARSHLNLSPGPFTRPPVPSPVQQAPRLAPAPARPASPTPGLTGAARRSPGRWRSSRRRRSRRRRNRSRPAGIATATQGSAPTSAAEDAQDAEIVRAWPPTPVCAAASSSRCAGATSTSSDAR